MKDNDIQSIIDSINKSVGSINTLLATLHERDVEIKLVFNDAKSDHPPFLYIWKAVEHIDYVKAPK